MIRRLLVLSAAIAMVSCGRASDRDGTSHSSPGALVIVSAPDVSGMAGPVQQQIRGAYDALLRIKADRGASAPDLAKR
jgi:hypothetical protein